MARGSRCRPLPRATVIAALAALVITVASPIQAVEPDEILPDARLEARARAISTELRCLVCQNQTIDDSNAPLARDLRLLVRERLTGGATDAQVLDFVVARYGEFVLLRPRLNSRTVVLWGVPLILLLLAGVTLWRARSRQSLTEPIPQALSKAEAKRLAELLAPPKT